MQSRKRKASTILEIYNWLYKAFGPQGWWPVNGKYFPGNYAMPRNESERLEICIGAILTQNTAWKNVEKTINKLKKHGLIDKSKIKKIPEGQLAELIKSSGYFNQKAKKLKAFVNYNGRITRQDLLGIWGLGPETVDSILLYAYHKPVFVVDAYTKRIFSRIGLCSQDISYEELQKIFHTNLPKDYKLYNEYHALLVELGKSVCKKKPLCSECPIRGLCNYGKKYKKQVIYGKENKRKN